MISKRPRWAIHAVVLALYAIWTLVATWPLARHLDRALADSGDPYLNVFLINWDQFALTTDPFSFFHAAFFAPAKYALAFSEHQFGIAILGLPLYLAGASPVTIYNVLFFASFVFAGYGAFLLARYVVRDDFAAFIGGAIFAFIGFRFDHLSHLQLLWTVWLPLIFLTLLRFVDAPTWKNAAAFSAAFLMNGLTNVHWFIFGSFVALSEAPVLAYVSGTARDKRFWIRFAVAIGVAVVLLLPFLLPYRAAQEMYEMQRGVGENLHGSATPVDWLIATPRSRAYGSSDILSRAMPERVLFPGLLAIFGALAAILMYDRRAAANPERLHLATRVALATLDVAIFATLLQAFLGYAFPRRILEFGVFHIRAGQGSTAAMVFLLLLFARFLLRYPGGGASEGASSLSETIARSRWPLGLWAAAGAVIIGYLGSLGLNGLLYSVLFEKFEVFKSIRTPGRFAIVAYVGLAVLAAAGVAALRARAGRGKLVVSAVVLVAAIADLAPIRINWFLAPTEPAEVHRWLASVNVPGSVVELPIGLNPFNEVTRVFNATVHHKPIVNGMSGFETPLHRRLGELQRSNPIPDEFLLELRNAGCSLVIVHADELMEVDSSTREWLTRQLRGGGLVFVRRFDHNVSGDWVFALREHVPAFATHVADQSARDRSGRTAAENLTVFLDRTGFTYNSGSFGVLDGPKEWDQKRGRLEIAGWALAPQGIRSIELKLSNGRVVLKPERFDGLDLKAAFPWYDHRLARYRIVLDNPPPGVDRYTDVEVELVDGTGRRTSLGDVPFRWDASRRIAIANLSSEAIAAYLVRIGASPAHTAAAVVEGRVTVDEVITPFLDSHGRVSDPEFVEKAYLAVLARPVDEYGAKFYGDLLRRRHPRDEIVVAILDSEEFRKQVQRR